MSPRDRLTVYIYLIHTYLTYLLLPTLGGTTANYYGHAALSLIVYLPRGPRANSTSMLYYMYYYRLPRVSW